MGLTSLGTVTIGVGVPAAASANAALLVTGNIAAPDVSAQIAALATFTPSVALTFSDQLSITTDVIANLNAAISAIPPIPTLSLSAQVALAASISATLSATLATINTQLAIQASIDSLLATAGMAMYAWDGANNAFGPALTTALGGATTHTNGLVLYTANSATWTSMQSVFKTT